LLAAAPPLGIHRLAAVWTLCLAVELRFSG